MTIANLCTLDELHQFAGLQMLYPGWRHRIREDRGNLRWWSERWQPPTEDEAAAGLLQEFGSETAELLRSKLAVQAEIAWRCRAF